MSIESGIKNKEIYKFQDSVNDDDYKVCYYK